MFFLFLKKKDWAYLPRKKTVHMEIEIISFNKIEVKFSIYFEILACSQLL